MKLFIRKTLYVFTISFFTYLILINVVPLIKPLNEIPDGYRHTFDSSEIIICGDSRADRQVDPAIVFKKTGLNTINIGKEGQDVYSLSKSFRAAGIENKILIISASYFQANDGVLADRAISTQAYLDLDAKQKWQLYRWRPIDYLRSQQQLLIHAIKAKSMLSLDNESRKINLDFNPQSCREFKISKRFFSNHPWYKSPNINGIKWSMVQRALADLASLKNCRILVYNGPVSSDFYNAGMKEGVVQLEKEYDKQMLAACKKYNFLYHSFLTDTSLSRHADYYDPQHLCRSGVSKMSNSIVEIIQAAGFLNRGEGHKK